MDQVVDAFFSMDFQAGQDAIRQGDAGDNVYIVKSGAFDIFVKKSDAPQPYKVSYPNHQFLS